MSTTIPETHVKKCTNHIRGCRVILEEDYKFKKCSECLKKERERDHKKRNAVKEMVAADPDNKICSVCCQEQPLDQFQGLRSTELTKTCKSCRDGNKVQDAKRDKEHRNELDRINSKKPERIAVKKEWETNNYEKVVEKWQRYRQNKINTDIDDYLQGNAENQKKWRENSPEKNKATKQVMRNTPTIQYVTYQREAFNRNLLFELTSEQFETMVKSACYYCGLFTENCDINGVDRKDSSKHYYMENCVPCCKMCNMMKNTLNENTFLKRIQHIVSYLNLVEKKICYPEAFANYGGASYSDYKNRALKKEIAFTISHNDYYTLISGLCYLCGKESTDVHGNGIDRLDNNVGYVLENCRSCCANCNYMKKAYSYDEFIYKLLDIYKIHTPNDNEDSNNFSSSMCKGNKMSLEELTVHSNTKRNQRKQQMILNYSDEMIKKNAIRVAEARKIKKGGEN